MYLHSSQQIIRDLSQDAYVASENEINMEAEAEVQAQTNRAI